MHMKTTLFIFGAAAALGIAYWLISPLWRNVKLNEELPHRSASPQNTGGASSTHPMIKDNMGSMDEQTKKDFMQAVEKMKDKTMTTQDPMPSSNQPVIIAQAAMVARAHAVEGRALLMQAGDQKVLRFEDLKTINGPDLRIYLSAGLNNDDSVDLGPIRATEGNVNYAIPPGTDTHTYRNALIWCRAFGVLFSYAEL